MTGGLHGRDRSGLRRNSQDDLVPEAVRRAKAYLEAGADCVFPIALREMDALCRFTGEVRGPLNVLRLPEAPSVAELAALGVVRVSWASLLHMEAMAHFEKRLASLEG